MRNIAEVEKKAREIEDSQDVVGKTHASIQDIAVQYKDLDIIEGGRNFLPDVDFSRFNKYQFLFNESSLFQDHTRNLQGPSKPTRSV